MWINGVRQSILNYRNSEMYISDISLPGITVTASKRIAISGHTQTFMKNEGQSYTFLQRHLKIAMVMTIKSAASTSYSFTYYGSSSSCSTTSMSISGFDSGVHKYMQLLCWTSSSKYSQMLSNSNV